ncbi:MAG: ribosome biogenesis GTPase Der [Patescibacteria group bacterium]
MKNKIPQVAIVGRANVGKSTLFNCLIEKNKAIISNIAGTTRDRNIDLVKWRDRQFTLIDTGGLDVDKKGGGIIEINIVKQAQKAISTADLVLFLIDVKAGVLATDRELARELVKKNLKKKTILIGNKADSMKWRQMSGELYKLNLGEPIMLSALSGSGTGDLLDLIIEKLPKTKSPTTDNQLPTIKIAIIGKPNVGKSSLLNAILGEERVIVTDIPHTTRESHDAEFIYQENRFILVDTAGIIKKGKIVPGSLEKKSIAKSIQTIAQADVVILVTEVNKDIGLLDKKITQEILENSKPMIIVANKWDLIPEKDTNTVNKYVDYYRAIFPYLWWAPIIFISAKSGQRARKILDLVLEIKKSSEVKISDSQLQKFLKSQIKKHKPSRGKGLKNPYIYEIKQTGSTPPRFMITVNDPTTLHFSYLRFLQNNLREKFKIIGTPIQIETKKWKK